MTDSAPHFAFGQPEENPGYLLWQLSMRWQREVNAALRTLELTHTQFVILAATRWLELQAQRQQLDPPSKTAIGEHTSLDRMLAAKTVRKLSDRQWLTTRPDLQDSRAHLVQTTRAGRSRLDQALDLVNEVDKRLFGQLPQEAITGLREVWQHSERHDAS